ncbi:MAG: 6-carboxytetrahydropterin synthase [Bdellovibrionales bacterium]
MALSATTKRYSFRGVHSLTSGVHREKYHGHQYFLEVSFEKCLLADIDHVVKEKILTVLDGHDLTKKINPATGEVIVEWIQAQLDATPLRAKILGVALQETRKNRFVSARSVAQLI